MLSASESKSPHAPPYADQNQVKSRIFRANYLISLAWRGHFRRLRYDLMQELVVFTCSAVLVGLFYYIFNDFIHEKVARISTTLQDVLARSGAVAALFFVALFCVRAIRKERESLYSIQNTCRRLGENPRVIALYLKGQSVLLFAVYFAMGWAIVTAFLPAPGLPFVLAVQLPLTALVFVLLKIPPQRDALERNLALPFMEPRAKANRRSTMVRWRAAQMVFRNRFSRFALLLVAAGELLLMICAWQNFPITALAMLALIMGLILASTLNFQLSEDLRYSWAEKNMGVAHEDLMRVYSILAAVLAFTGGILALLASLTGDYGVSVWKVPALMALAPLMTPSLMLQIDGRRPAIQVMVTFLISLFLGTGILVHGLTVVLVPFLIHYATQYQQGRFYRA